MSRLPGNLADKSSLTASLADGADQLTMPPCTSKWIFPDSAFSALRLSPVEFVREMRVAAALKWYEAGTISQSKAAAVAGVSREALLMAAGKFRVSAVQATPAEMAEELGRD
jgi:hypothetical protein